MFFSSEQIVLAVPIVYEYHFVAIIVLRQHPKIFTPLIKHKPILEQVVFFCFCIYAYLVQFHSLRLYEGLKRYHRTASINCFMGLKYPMPPENAWIAPIIFPCMLNTGEPESPGMM